MSVSPEDDPETRKQKLSETIDALRQQIAAIEEPGLLNDSSPGRRRPGDERILKNYENQLRKAQDEYNAIVEASSSAPDLSGSAFASASGSGSLSSAPSPSAPPSPSSSPGAPDPGSRPRHPLEEVAGRYVRVKDLLALQFANDNALSTSTRDALTLACRWPVTETDSGEPVIGTSSFIRGVLSKGSHEAASGSTTLAAALTGALRSNSPVAARIQSLLEIESLTAPFAGDTNAADRALADPNLTRVLADAVQLVNEFNERKPLVQITHAIIASLSSASGQAAFKDLNLIGASGPAFFQRLSIVVSEHLVRNASQFPTLTEQVRSGVTQRVAQLHIRLEPEQVSRVSYVADEPVVSLTGDRLDMADDARALAEVICLRDPGPPLAIGLFGDWGSGKSTFMNLIEAAIEDLTEGSATDDAAREALVSKVVHIRFNAWHYSDSNLWASITSEFFSQLRAGGHGKSAATMYAKLVSEVIARAGALDGDTATSAQQAATARHEAIELRKDLEHLEIGRRQVFGNALAESMAQSVREGDARTVKRIEAAFAAIGRPVEVAPDKETDPIARREALADVASAEVRAVAESANATVDTVQLVWAAVRNNLTQWFPMAIGMAFLLAFLASFLWPFTSQLRTWATRVIVAATPVAILLVHAYRAVQPILVAARNAVLKRSEQTATIERQMRETRGKLEEAEQRERDAAKKHEETVAEAARFKNPTPTRVFDYYLNVSADTRQFEQQLGTVSHVRRVFEQLNAIYLERGAPSRAKPAPTPQADAVAPVQPAAPATSTEFDIDRIVLYIDDLDRCQFRQVVTVLEAVHLLLAFRLFVVVVGVDARWLEKSLLTIYKDQLKEQSAGLERQATVQDYLEKIFQIPIQLRELSSRSDSELRPYLEAVAGPLEDDPSSRATAAVPPPAPATRAKGDFIDVLEPLDVKLKDAKETARETVTRITLHRHELESMELLAPFLGKSPRAIKRFMNVYRLLRGRRRGGALDAFLANVGGVEAPSFACQFWLAVYKGLSPELAAIYRDALLDTSLSGIVVEALRTLDGADAGSTEVQRLATMFQRHLDSAQRTRHAKALEAILSRYKGDGRAVLVDMEKEVQRFSLPSRARSSEPAPPPHGATEKAQV